ncbi:MAG: hypothetical protein EA369_04850 [Bradymonadales bacterium]|nr:MAG: hypothetical protein EA369_04850 [Bradymonadales bacterium]
MRLWPLILMAAIQFSCGGGVNADLEKARFLLGTGRQEAASKAFHILEPLVVPLAGQPPRVTGEKLLEALELYAGAQLGRAGVDPIRVLSRLLHKEDNEKVRDAFRQAIDPVIQDSTLQDVERFDVFQDGINRLTLVIGNLGSQDPRFGEAGFVARTPSEDYSGASESLQRRVDLAVAQLLFFQSLLILIDETDFNKEDLFDPDECENALKGLEFLDELTRSLYRARWFYNRGGLDDTFFGSAASNHDILEFIEELQAQFDSDAPDANDPDSPDAFNGEFREEVDEDKAKLVCDYLQGAINE